MKVVPKSAFNGVLCTVVYSAVTMCNACQLSMDLRRERRVKVLACMFIYFHPDVSTQQLVTTSVP